MSFKNIKSRVLSSLILIVISSQCFASEIRIALKNKPDTLDPHRYNVGNNLQVTSSIYQQLIGDEFGNESLQEGIIEDIVLIDQVLNTWQVNLRKNIKFHNGKELTVEDVIFSIDRIRQLPNSPSSFRQYVEPIVSMTVVDQYRIDMRFKKGYAEFNGDLSKISIVSKPSPTYTHLDNDVSFSGTHFYRLVNYDLEKNVVELERFDGNRLIENAIKKVNYVFISDDNERMEALINNEVDVVDRLSLKQIKQLQKKGFKSFTRNTNRVIFLQLDTFREQTPFITDHKGRSLDTNPLKDRRVRQAISIAINREQLIESVMDGNANPAGQIFLSGSLLASKNLKPINHNLQKARRLMKEAGYKNGFKLTIHGPEGRYIRDKQLINAIASMLADINIDAQAKSLPAKEYFAKALAKHTFSINLLGWAPNVNGSYTFNNLFLPPDRDRQLGSGNAGRYNNEKLNQLILKAQETFDDIYRRQLYQRASELVINDVAIIPLHFQVVNWGMSAKVNYFPKPGTWRTNIASFRLAR
ncbi:ABC transporter substrate-binding protein [Veronia pacifica]|uniref:Solute-binding protein family 5 domain-containing protein n=2 Tax=Veronia pacifica TaxID=1080227 RepID=A0A1C3EPD3_9GAMM|nr:ABC transporter substrate-binding protein [Veronia pacifica]ODA35107.1 hypothetical protein A8L45_05365 [Veronia pacifica]